MDADVTTAVVQSASNARRFTVTTTIRNDGASAMALQTNPCRVRFRVETLEGTRVALGEQNCSAISMPVSLAPGQSFSFTDQWDGTDRMGARLSGMYRVIGQPMFEQGPQSAPVIIQLLD